MTKPITSSNQTVLEWLNNVNRLSENVGDPDTVYVADGSYTAHNAAYPSIQITPDSFPHAPLAADVVVSALNDLNTRKLKRTGDIVSGNWRIGQSLIVDGDAIINGGDVLSTNTNPVNLFNTTTTTLNLGGAATSLTIGATTGTATIRNANVVLTGDLDVRGGDLITNQTTFNLLNTTATTLNLGGAATALTIGATTGTATIRNANVVLTGDLAANGGDITTTATTFNLLDTTATTLNLARAATSLTIGATTGTATIRNANVVLTGDLAVNGGDITTTATTFNLLDATATTLNLARAATSLTIGATTGTATIRNASVVLSGDFAVNGGDITTTATTFNLLDTTATTINFGGAASAVSIGAATGTTSIHNNLQVDGGLTVTQPAVFNSHISLVGSNTIGTEYLMIRNGNSDLKLSVDSFNGNIWTAGSIAVSMGSTLTGEVVCNNNLKVVSSSSSLILNNGTSDTFQVAANTGNVTISGTMNVSGAVTINNQNLSTGTGVISGVGSGITSLNANNLSTGTVSVARGGTGLSSYAAGDLLYASGTTTLAKLAKPTANKILSHNATSPVWTTASYPTGSVPVNRLLGTNNSTADSIIPLTLTAGTGISLTYGAAGITITATGELGATDITGDLFVDGKITNDQTITIGSASPQATAAIQATAVSGVTSLMVLRDSTSANKFTVDLSGNTVASGTMTVHGDIFNNAGGSQAVLDKAISSSVIYGTTPASSDVAVIGNSTVWRSAELQVQASIGTTRLWTYKILAIHDGANVNYTVYGTTGIGADPISSFDVVLASSNLVLRATGATASSTVNFKVRASALAI